MTHEVGSVTRVTAAECLCAMLLVRAGHQLAAQGQGAFGWLRTAVRMRGLAFASEAVVFPECDAGA